MQSLPGPVASLCQSLLAALDQALPGQLEAFYVTGSVALGDYRDGQSDLDFIAVLSDVANSAALTGVHADLAARFPHIDCDGIYLRPGELARPPGGKGPAARDGRVTLASADERHPVSWLLLADSGIALRGPKPDHSLIAADRDAASAYSRANLAAYWQGWLARYRLVSGRLDQAQADDAVAWSVLGVLRVHHTMVSGSVGSKSAAADHGLTHFPRHSQIIAEALRLRTTPDVPGHYRSSTARALAASALVADVIASGG